MIEYFDGVTLCKFIETSILKQMNSRRLSKRCYEKIFKFKILNGLYKMIGCKDGYNVYNYMQQDSYLYGGEFNFSKKTGFDWLSYNTSLWYIFAESADGDALPFIAPLTFNQVFNIDFSSNYSLEIDFLAKAKQGRVAMFEEETDGYSLLNLSGNWKTSFLDNDLDIFWSIDNVFDTEYFDHLSRLKESGIAGLGRNISVGLKYNF